MTRRVKVVDTHQIAPGTGRLSRVEGRELALFNVDGEFYAIDNLCAHSRGPLADGRVAGTTVTCPWHGSRFNVTNGKCLEGPANIDVMTYTVHVEDDVLYVDLP